MLGSRHNWLLKKVLGQDVPERGPEASVPLQHRCKRQNAPSKPTMFEFAKQKLGELRTFRDTDVVVY